MYKIKFQIAKFEKYLKQLVFHVFKTLKFDVTVCSTQLYQTDESCSLPEVYGAVAVDVVRIKDVLSKLFCITTRKQLLVHLEQPTIQVNEMTAKIPHTCKASFLQQLMSLITPEVQSPSFSKSTSFIQHTYTFVPSVFCWTGLPGCLTLAER